MSTAGDTYIKNLAKTAASWNVETNGAGTTAVAGGETVNFINGDNIAITNTGRSITIGTARNVSFDKVTVGGMFSIRILALMQVVRKLKALLMLHPPMLLLTKDN